MIRLGPQACKEYVEAVLFGACILVCVPFAIAAIPLWCVGKGAMIIEAALARKVK